MTILEAAEEYRAARAAFSAAYAAVKAAEEAERQAQMRLTKAEDALREAAVQPEGQS
jgi:hypothetical protein